jgi:hypothetical protein
MIDQRAPIYLQAEFNVARANHTAFVKKMQEILPVIFTEYGWELIYGAYPIVGEVNRFIHIWRIPNEESVLRVMRDGAVTMGEPSENPPDNAGAEERRLFVFKTLYGQLQELITDTKHTLTTSLPHDPTYFGEQAQTLLIDCKGHTFLIDHDRLRDKAGGKTKRINQLRSAPSWSKWKNPVIRSADLKHHGRNAANADTVLQTFLNQGALVATLTEGGDATKHGPNRHLLFNLAGIKPRSVFQETPAPPRSDSEPAVAIENAKVAFPKGVTNLLISTPWGVVYNLDRNDVEELVSGIPESRVTDTARVLAPLIGAKVPLANIPQERDALIGDGCMCFVINLSSFEEDAAQHAWKTVTEKE